MFKSLAKWLSVPSGSTPSGNGEPVSTRRRRWRCRRRRPQRRRRNPRRPRRAPPTPRRFPQPRARPDQFRHGECRANMRGRGVGVVRAGKLRRGTLVDQHQQSHARSLKLRSRTEYDTPRHTSYPQSVGQSEPCSVCAAELVESDRHIFPNAHATGDGATLLSLARLFPVSARDTDEIRSERPAVQSR